MGLADTQIGRLDGEINVDSWSTVDYRRCSWKLDRYEAIGEMVKYIEIY